MTNIENFKTALTTAYTVLLKTPEYAYAAQRNTPEQLAEKMTQSFISKTASNDGQGVKMACKACGIKTTYKAIYAYLGV